MHPLPAPLVRRRQKDPLQGIKTGIWLYFFLLIFEGCLRKWILPSLTNPLLVIRDPVVVWILLNALGKGCLPINLFTISAPLIGLIGLLTAMTIGHGNLIVALYGARILILHFPLVFVIGRVFTRGDVLRMGKITMLLGIPMLLLIVDQFYSPQTAWVNLGVNGEGAGFSGAEGYARPPGTFSFTIGTTLFFSFMAPFVFYFWMEPKRIAKPLFIISSIALLLSLPFSISRALVIEVLISMVFALVAGSRRPHAQAKIFVACAILIISSLIIMNISFSENAIHALISRFEKAGDSEGGAKGLFIDRVLGGSASALFCSGDQPILGYGIGIGTNVGAQLLIGSRGFLIAEGEWARVIGELGPILGLFIIALRVVMTYDLLSKSMRCLGRGDCLPWMLASTSPFVLLFLGWAQPTCIGFYTMIVGLHIASCNSTSQSEKNAVFLSDKVRVGLPPSLRGACKPLRLKA